MKPNLSATLLSYFWDSIYRCLGSIKRLFQHTLIYGLATVLPKLLTVLLTKLLTTYLPGEVEFGEVSIIFSYIIFANVVLTYGMETAFFRFHHEDEHRERTTSTAMISLFGSTLLFVALVYLLMEPISGAMEIDAEYLKWVVPVVALDALMVIPFAKMRADQKPKKYALIKMLNVVLSVGTTFLFFTALPSFPEIAQHLPTDRIELFFIAFLAANLITFSLICGIYFKSWTFDRVLWKNMLSYGWPILIAGLAFAVNETVDKILLQKFLPMSEADAEATVGIYTAGYRLAVGMTLFAQAFRLGVEPFFFSQSGDKNAPEQYALITKAYISLGVIALFAYVILVDFIRPLLVDDEFVTAMDIVPIILIAYLFSGVYQTLSVWYKINDKTYYGAIISTIAAVITIGLNIALIPKYGYYVSAAATCAAYGLMMVISYVWSRSHFVIPYEIGKLVGFLFLGIGFTAIFYYFVRDYYGVETLETYVIGTVMLLILAGIVLYFERNSLKSLLVKKS